jgi:uncharacterized protein (DUF849 family)
MWLKACLNGSRVAGEHPRLPLTPAELAADAVAVRRAGAQAVHVHPRDAAGGESLAAADVGATVGAIRTAAPGLPVGVTTGLWVAGGDPRRRLETVRTWADLPEDSRPDFASCNVSEPGFRELAITLMDAYIDVEVGVWSPRDAGVFAQAGLIDEALRVLLEVIGVPAGKAAAYAVRLLTEMDELALDVPRLLHGEGDAAWPVFDVARRYGVASRIGFEDVLTGPSGEPVTGNADLVRLALAR